MNNILHIHNNTSNNNLNEYFNKETLNFFSYFVNTKHAELIISNSNLMSADYYLIRIYDNSYYIYIM